MAFCRIWELSRYLQCCWRTPQHRYQPNSSKLWMNDIPTQATWQKIEGISELENTQWGRSGVKSIDIPSRITGWDHTLMVVSWVVSWWIQEEWDRGCACKHVLAYFVVAELSDIWQTSIVLCWVALSYLACYFLSPFLFIVFCVRAGVCLYVTSREAASHFQDASLLPCTTLGVLYGLGVCLEPVVTLQAWVQWSSVELRTPTQVDACRKCAN